MLPTPTKPTPERLIPDELPKPCAVRGCTGRPYETRLCDKCMGEFRLAPAGVTYDFWLAAKNARPSQGFSGHVEEAVVTLEIAEAARAMGYDARVGDPIGKTPPRLHTCETPRAALPEVGSRWTHTSNPALMGLTYRVETASPTCVTLICEQNRHAAFAERAWPGAWRPASGASDESDADLRRRALVSQAPTGDAAADARRRDQIETATGRELETYVDCWCRGTKRRMAKDAGFIRADVDQIKIPDGCEPVVSANGLVRFDDVKGSPYIDAEAYARADLAASLKAAEREASTYAARLPKRAREPLTLETILTARATAERVLRSDILNSGIELPKDDPIVSRADAVAAAARFCRVPWSSIAVTDGPAPGEWTVRVPRTATSMMLDLRDHLRARVSHGVMVTVIAEDFISGTIDTSKVPTFTRAMAHARLAFFYVAEAMQTPRGRRVLAVQAIDAAVYACPTGLVPEAYRAALMHLQERNGGLFSIGETGRHLVTWLGASKAERDRDFGNVYETGPAYERALAALRSPRIGRAARWSGGDAKGSPRTTGVARRFLPSESAEAKGERWGR